MLDDEEEVVDLTGAADGSQLAELLSAYDAANSQVVVKEERKTFAGFLTQICAIIGGVFTVTGLIDASFYHGSNALRRKMEIGKAA